MSLSAHSPDGALWFLYAGDEVPNLLVTKAPARGRIIDTVYESQTFFSTNRTIARQLIVNNAGGFTALDRPINAGLVEYVEFLTPGLVSWVLGLQDDGILYLELFSSGVPKNRRLFTTVLHKGKLLWVADNRERPPTR